MISLTTPYTHQGSKKNLLGENPDATLVASMSSELQVTSSTPPTFLFHTDADTGVPPENSVLFYLALTQSEGSGRAAHLRKRAARAGTGQGRARRFGMARPAGRLDARERASGQEVTGMGGPSGA